MFITFYLASIGLLSYGLASAQSIFRANSIDEAKRAIAASNELYFQAFAKHDVLQFISLYAEDCWIMPPNAPVLCGPDAPGDFFEMTYTKLG